MDIKERGNKKMSFYDNLRRYKKSMNNQLLSFMLRKLQFEKVDIGNKYKRLARRSDKLCRRTFSYSSFFEEEGYLTVESALVIPIFLFVIITFFYIFIMFTTDMDIYKAMKESSRDIGYIEALLAPETNVAGRDLSIKANITKNLGSGFIKDNIIKGGISGIDVSGSSYDKDTGVLDIVVSYKYKIPYSVLDLLDISRKQRFKSRLYTGKNIYEQEDEKYVYVTKNGKVYHCDINCSYLNIKIKEIDFNAVGDYRNEWGEKYYPCENCMKEDAPIVYITEDGNRYHSSKECYSLNRNVYKKKLSEVHDMPPCSRCGK